MNLYVSLYLFLIGLCFGSFALAVADRIKTNKDWVRGRSECDNCKHKLSARDLVPVLSWTVARGKCRYCKVKLPAIYPLAEISVGCVFLFSFVFWPVQFENNFLIAQFFIWLGAVTLLCILFIYDLRWFKLPFIIMNPLIGLGVMWAVLDVANQGFSMGLLLQYGLALLVGAGVFQLLYTLSKGKWIGDGDIRLGIAIGLFTGSPLEAWLVIFIASLLGILIGLPSIITAKKSKSVMKLKVPFGPPLIIALWVTVLFGASVIEWYKINVLYL